MDSRSEQPELLSESEHTRVLRVRLSAGRSVIRKEPLGPDADARISHEVGILRRLSGVRHIVPLAAERADATAILLEDVHGVPLTRVTTPLDGDRLVELAIDLAAGVSAMHERGVVHGDINPSNILVTENGRCAYLIDFALATTFAERRAEFMHPHEVVGTMPYLAPEQTGRTGRAVDRRADLYGLGATMYELATGRPPFGTGDPLRLIHDHLARIAVPPATVNAATPPGLSEVIMHLLEKEPDNRYQTAEGLSRDLERVRKGVRQVQIGADDVPLRLSEPTRLVAREGEIDVLRAATERARAGECAGVTISGRSGSGKSALIDGLRPIVTHADGWFTSGKFDRERQDEEYNGVIAAVRGLGRLLLAEPEEELAELRRRLRRELGPNAALAAALLPEFATLLETAPERGDPLTSQIRTREALVGILRAVASRKRPMVFAVDDLQWSGEAALELLDQLLIGGEPIGGLFTVVAYRDDAPATHPLAAMAPHWEQQPGRPQHIQLTNLDQDHLAALAGEMLRIPRGSAADLAMSIVGVTEGNPYETVELLNGLRRDGLLRPSGSGWRWDRPALERRLERENVTEMVRTRLTSLPEDTADTLQAMACLGGEVSLNTLGVATDLSVDSVQQRLAPAVEEELLDVVHRGQAARFHHDRLRDLVFNGIAAPRLRGMRLTMARRLAGQPELFAVAADQYLPVVDELHDESERRRVAALLCAAADRRLLVGENQPAERMLAAALHLTDQTEMLVKLHHLRYAALFRLGRLEEADEVYQTIIGLTRGPYDRVEPTRAQISSLTARNRPDEAIGLGLDLLRELGWTVSTSEQATIEIERELDWCREWIDTTSAADDLRRATASDPKVVAAGALISSMMAACFLRDPMTAARLALAATRIWAQNGPTSALIGAVGNVAWILIARRQAYRSGHRLLHRLLRVGEQREFEPGTSLVRFLYALGMCHWFDPADEALSHAARAREGLVRGGDVQTAAYAFYTPVFCIDVANTIDEYLTGIDAAADFARRTGTTIASSIVEPYRWLVNTMRGEPSADGDTMVSSLAGQPIAEANAYVARALAAALLDDLPGLAEHSAAAMRLRSAVESMYPDWQTRLLRAIALAHRVSALPDRTAELSELDDIVAWVAERAAAMPTNFRHMLSLIKAERAWAVGDFRSAIQAFDSAKREAGHRPWHRAYIAERSATFMLAHGLDGAAWELLVEAREAYRLWGARAKVDQLDRAYPSLGTPAEAAAAGVTRRASITAGAIDMRAILDASRALSSETTVGALRTKVVEVLSAMTGATDVSVRVWSGEQRQWLAPTGDGDLVAPSQPQASPDSVIRYVDRTREPLLVGDATRDDRFARDPYFRDMQACSLLAAPVLSRGLLRAILLLENRLIRDAFPPERLEVVTLIASQLAITLDNALIYSSLERQVADRTEQLADANERLAQLSITDPLTGLANRRRFDETLRNEWQRAQRTHVPLSLAMVDIDHFKQYNDRYGHREGDRCLQRVATQIERTVRSVDLVARYGGEEFAVVMPETDSAPAYQAAERVRLAVSALEEPLGSGSVVTVSIGVATVHDTGPPSADQFIERADAALYEAKRSGRNRVCSDR